MVKPTYIDPDLQAGLTALAEMAADGPDLIADLAARRVMANARDAELLSLIHI